MTASQVRIEPIDEATRTQARQLADALDRAGETGATLHIEGRLAELIRDITRMASLEATIVYGGLSSELTPEQAGKILGVSRPLVVRRMEDGRLPFRYEGEHRRCKLTDVLNLKTQEDKQTAALRELAEDMDDVDYRPAPAS